VALARLPLSTALDAFSGSGVRILPVEDNAVNRALAQRLLEKRDFSVCVAVDGKEAIAAMQRAEFDAVVTDIQMPEADRFEATAEIHKRERIAAGERLSSRSPLMR
jgi:CheY-like chemotaxis protein